MWLEIVKTIIEHVLSWPVAAVILCLVFREHLIGLINRVISFKGPGGFDVSVSPASVQAIISPPETLKGEIGSTSSEVAVTPTTTPMPTGHIIDQKRESVRRFAEGIIMVDESVVAIKAELAELEMPLDSAETGEILVRHLAATQLMVRCERTHRLIFGSQILALHMMNGTRQTESALTTVYENARAKEPQFYGSYPFGDWMGFLMKETLVLKAETGEYAITVYGQTYLGYVGLFALTPRPH